MGSDSYVVQPWIWGTWTFHLDICEDLGQGCILLVCGIRFGPVQHRFYPRIVCAGISEGSHCWLILRSCPFWGFRHTGWDLRGLYGPWVLPKAHSIPNFWLASNERVPTKSVIICVQELRPFLYDEVYRHQVERGSMLPLDDFSGQPRPCHHHRCTDNAITSRSCRQYCIVWPLIVSYPKETGKTWWRQLSGITRFWFALVHVISVPWLIRFHLEERNWRLLLCEPDGKD